MHASVHGKECIYASAVAGGGKRSREQCRSERKLADGGVKHIRHACRQQAKGSGFASGVDIDLSIVEAPYDCHF